MSEPKRDQHKKLIAKLSLVVVGMFGFGFALVPLYSVICDAFGLNGRFVEIDAGTYDAQGKSADTLKQGIDESRTIKVQFLASRNQNMPWEFRPVTQQLEVHPGQVEEVTYYAKNNTGRKMVGQAVPSLTPGEAVKYFTKIECFCFNQQTFEAGEERKMPLRFVIDRRLPDDVNTVTLSYTFFDAGDKVKKNKVSANGTRGSAAAETAVEG